MDEYCGVSNQVWSLGHFISDAQLDEIARRMAKEFMSAPLPKAETGKIKMEEELEQFDLGAAKRNPERIRWWNEYEGEAKPTEVHFARGTPNEVEWVVLEFHPGESAVYPPGRFHELRLTKLPSKKVIFKTYKYTYAGTDFIYWGIPEVKWNDYDNNRNYICVSEPYTIEVSE